MTLIIKIACACGVQVIVPSYDLRWSREKPQCATCAEAQS